MEETTKKEPAPEQETNKNEAEATEVSESDLEQVAGGAMATEQEQSANLPTVREGLLDVGIGKKNFFKL